LGSRDAEFAGEHEAAETEFGDGEAGAAEDAGGEHGFLREGVREGRFTGDTEAQRFEEAKESGVQSSCEPLCLCVSCSSKDQTRASEGSAGPWMGSHRWPRRARPRRPPSSQTARKSGLHATTS